MAIAHGLGQREGNPRPHADHRGLLDPEFFGDHVRRAEADAADVLCEPIRVLAHDLHGIRAIGLEDPHRARRAHPMLVQEDHDLADHLLIRPARRDLGRAHGANACDLAQPLGCGLDDVEDVFPEGLYQALGIDRSNAADHAGAEVFLDAVDR